MAKQEKDALKFTTPEFRASFVNVFERDKKGKYGITMLFKTGEDLTLAKKMVAKCIKATWGDKPPKNLKLPFRDQGEKEYDGYVDGATFCTASSKKFQPGVVDGRRNNAVLTDPVDFYSGCWAKATLVPFPYGHRKEDDYSPGVAFGLRNVQKVRDDEPLAGRSNPEDDFEPIETDDLADMGDEAEDPLAGLL